MDEAALRAYAQSFRDAVLHGSNSDRMCVAISEPLHSALALEGQETLLIESDLEECNHVFLALPDGRVLDATADQFDDEDGAPFPAVYIGPPKAIHRRAARWCRPSSWCGLLRESRRLYPTADPSALGRFVRLVLSTLPPDVISFSAAPETPSEIAPVSGSTALRN